MHHIHGEVQLYSQISEKPSIGFEVLQTTNIMFYAFKVRHVLVHPLKPHILFQLPKVIKQ